VQKECHLFQFATFFVSISAFSSLLAMTWNAEKPEHGLVEVQVQAGHVDAGDIRGNQNVTNLFW
jgi:hypothetical protein